MLRIEIKLYGETSTFAEPNETDEVLIAGLSAHGDKAFIQRIVSDFGMAIEEVEAF